MTMRLTDKQREELLHHKLPQHMPAWRRPKNPVVAAALYRRGLLTRADFSERGLHDERRLTWWEYQLTEAGRLAFIT